MNITSVRFEMNMDMSMVTRVFCPKADLCDDAKALGTKMSTVGCQLPSIQVTEH